VIKVNRKYARCLTSGGVFRHWKAAATTSMSRAESVLLGAILWLGDDVVVEDVEKKMFGRRIVGKSLESWKRKMEARKRIKGEIMSLEVKVRLSSRRRRNRE
jgi:hypothetical protein